jgi:hypothetical protein
MRALTTTAAALLLLSVSAHADGAQRATGQPATLQPVAIQAAAKKPITLYCRAIPHEGMVLRTGDCRTQKDWDTLRREEERTISDFQNHSYTH